MKYIKLFEKWIQLSSDYKGTEPRPGSRVHGGDEGEWKFVWNQENRIEDISSDLGLHGIYVYEIYQPQGLLQFHSVREGNPFLKKGTDLANSLFSDEFIFDKDWDGRDLMPSSMSNNRPSKYEWNSRFNKMVSYLVAYDVLVHTNYKDILFVSILKESDWRRFEELGFDVKEGSYSVKESKPYDRKGKERRFFDHKGKEIILGEDSEVETDTKKKSVLASIDQFLEKIS